ncbi:Methylpurine-DNA glycosylase [Sesbania bispinosa]|nr:Methylpurine-DNA glycosylase [Sesbania bispinosa]
MTRKQRFKRVAEPRLPVHRPRKLVVPNQRSSAPNPNHHHHIHKKQIFLWEQKPKLCPATSFKSTLSTLPPVCWESFSAGTTSFFRLPRLKHIDKMIQLVMFGPGGHAYVYLCYGLHMMLNVVADKEGVGSAVLIRSCAPISGLDVIQQRRGQKTDKPILLTGPGKVGQALGLTTEWSNHPLYTPGGLELLDGPEPENILVGPRVGIQYALPEHVNAFWRFAIADTPWISAPRNTLRPPL